MKSLIQIAKIEREDCAVSTNFAEVLNGSIYDSKGMPIKLRFKDSLETLVRLD